MRWLAMVQTAALMLVALCTPCAADIRYEIRGDGVFLEVTGADYDKWASGGAGPICARTGREIDRSDSTFPERDRCACATGAGHGNDAKAKRADLIARVDWCHRIAETGIVGEWIYTDGGFTDKHFFHAGGRAFGSRDNNPDPRAQGTWSIAGNILTVQWSNRWINRYSLPANHATVRVTGTQSGIGIDPKPGSRTHTITLRR